MSPDEIHFLLALYLIYLSDCFMLPRSTALVLYTPFGGLRMRVKSSSSSAVFADRFWLFRPLLPPLGFSSGLELPRCAFGAEGFCSASPVAEPASGGEELHYLSYGDVESIEVQDDTFKVNGETWFKGSRHGLQALRCGLESIVQSSDRPQAVRHVIDAEYATGGLAIDRVNYLRQQTGWLHLFCSTYAVWMLVYLPLAIFRFPISWLLWGVGVPLLVFHVICGWLFLRSHARLMPDEKSLRWEAFLKMFLCPPMMIRACDVVVDHAGIPGDPVAAVMACADEAAWKPQVRDIWRRLMPYRKTKRPVPAARAIEEYATVYRSVLKTALDSRGIDPELLEINAADIPKDQCYCPRCNARYRGDVEICSDCDGVPLLAGKKG